MLFKRRTEPPTEQNSNYFSYRNVYYKSNLGMPNCPCYGLGRFHEVGGEWLPVWHNAEDWASVLAPKGYIIHKTPLLGAVAIWRNGKAGVGLKAWTDGCGHVAIVEAIKANGDIICSNSGYYRSPAGVLPQNDKKYQALFWYEQTFKASKGYAWTGSTGKSYELIGFIYPKKFQSEPRTTMSFKKAFKIYIDAGTEFKHLTLSKSGDNFKYDGVYKIGNDGKKWLHGLLVKKSGEKPDLAGWISADTVC